MQRESAGGGGLGPQLAGEKITVNARTVSVVKQLGEGGFSFVYLVKDQSDGGGVLAPLAAESLGSSSQSSSGGGHGGSGGDQYMVLKITSVHSRAQRDIAEKEAKLLSRLSHPSIVRMVDTCYRAPSGGAAGGIAGFVGGGGAGGSGSGPGGSTLRPQHLILMEYCDGGHALDVCNRMRSNNQRFDLPSLIIAFGQICNAVSYLHAQRPPIVHRDLKPVNFLVKGGAYKLCDFGSAVFGHVDLRTPTARTEAEEVIEKTTTQMFRAPEMVDLYMAKKLTQSTDVWALGCCLYSLAFFQNCFEEGSNLAILSRNYKIPEDNPYGEGLVELIDRMLTVDYKSRADMTEVILCLSAIYSNRPLPARKKVSKHQKAETEVTEEKKVGKFRTDGQGMRKTKVEPKKPAEAKKLNPNSAAARRRRAMQGDSPNADAGAGDDLGQEPFESEQAVPPSTRKASMSSGDNSDNEDAFAASFSTFSEKFDFKNDPFGNSAEDKDNSFGSFHASDGAKSVEKSPNAGADAFADDNVLSFSAFEDNSMIPGASSWVEAQSSASAEAAFPKNDMSFPGFDSPEAEGKKSRLLDRGSGSSDVTFDTSKIKQQANAIHIGRRNKEVGDRESPKKGHVGSDGKKKKGLRGLFGGKDKGTT